MINIQKFTFNPFAENTYVVSDSTKSCVIIDPGCYSKAEKERLYNYIEDNALLPDKILLTHSHIDHIMGLEYVAEEWNLKTLIHQADLPILNSASVTAMAYGVPMKQPEVNLDKVDESSKVTFGNTVFDVIFTPGHSPGSVSYIDRESKTVFAGDVLFNLSIGRIDLPGASPADMKVSLFEKLMKLDDDFTVYSGHGEDTTIGYERVHNPFIKQPALIG